jgi:hypothetical protein
MYGNNSGISILLLLFRILVDPQIPHKCRFTNPDIQGSKLIKQKKKI